MAWKWEEIERDWLAGGLLAARPHEVVAAFNRVEDAFGREWIEQSRIGPGGIPSRGSAPVVHVVSIGDWLASLDGIARCEELLSRLRNGERSATTEAIAIHLLRTRDPSVEVELEPVVRVGDRERKPDFRTRKEDAPWTYVEVTAAETSAQRQEVDDALFRLRRVMDESDATSFALEFFLRRVPTEEEELYLIGRGLEICQREGQYEERLPARLGWIRLNLTSPGTFVADVPAGEEYAPRMGAMHRELGPGINRHVVVRIAFTDERAEEFLRSEARQLPREAPGLVIIFPAGATGAWDAWEATLLRRFQPTQHTRISAVCLVGSGLSDEGQGEAWRVETRLTPNEHAAIELPEWVQAKLLRFAEVRR